MRKTKYLLILGLVSIWACDITQSRQAGHSNVNNESPQLPIPPANNFPIHQDSAIRRIDFSNFTYDWYPAWANAPKTGRKVILKDGAMDLDFDYGKEPRKFLLIDDGVIYGDLTGDGNEEAVVVLRVITSGTARPSLIFVYTMPDEGAKRIWTYETGDRWDYGYHSASIRDGQLLIERYKPKIVEHDGQKHDMSASDTYTRDYYKWDELGFSKIKTEELPADPTDKNPWVARNAKPR